jgi:hypothetical protein
MATRPPHSAEEWEVWVRQAKRYRADWLPEDIGIRDWPEGITQGPGWFTLAEDHPFTGAEFCWRCIAEAQGFPAFEVIPHRRTEHVICWGPSEGNEAPEDPEPNAGPAEPPTGWSDRIIEASRFRPEVTDTGNLFWEGK